MSLRKSLSDTSAPRPEPKFQALFAHDLNSVSYVTPRSSVIASYFVRPGDLRLVDGVAALPVLDDLRRSLEGADLTDACDVAAVPLDAEHEFLVRVEPLCVDRELGHHALPVWSGKQ
jgi:hypothetical protein